MPNRIEARSAKAALTNATGRLPLLRLFSTPLIWESERTNRRRKLATSPDYNIHGGKLSEHFGGQLRRSVGRVIMELFHNITVFLVSEQEKASLLEAGVVFRSITRGERGESVQFDMGELDPRWKRVAAVLGSLQERDGLPKEHRVQDLSMTVPSWDELVQPDEGTRCRAHQVTAGAQMARWVFG
jgi:hypothetical protein